MPRDLFVETVTHKYAPKRSKWTIAGSILAHAALLVVMVVVPILSALDNYVVHANKLSFVLPPPAVMPAMPAPPPKVSTPVAAVNPDAAPRTPPEQPVTGEVPRPANYGPVPPGVLIGDGKVGMPGAGDATVVSASDYVPPPPAKRDPIRPGGNIKVPARTYYVEPIYPTIALAAKVEGYVILEATVDESGAVRNLKVLKSHPMLDKAALEAVAKWKYTPTLLNGTAVPIVMTVTVTFALR